MDEFISVDEALEMLFNEADMDDKQKLKRLFLYYSRGKIDFHTELFGSRHTRYGVRENQKESPESIEKLRGVFKLNREYCDEYFLELLLLHSGVEFKDNDVIENVNAINPYEFKEFYDNFSIELVEDMEGQVWQLKHQKPKENNGIEVYHTNSIAPQVDDLLIKTEQVTVLAQASKPHSPSTSEDGKRLGRSLNNALIRIEALEAALYILANKREVCINKNTGKVVAGSLTDELMDHSFKFLEGLDENGKSKKPRTRSSIYGYICDALNSDKKKNNN